MKQAATSNAAIALVVLALVLLAATTLRLARPSSEAVRLRNALLFQAASPSAFEWTPERLPADFDVDAEIRQSPFAGLPQTLGLAGLPDDKARALRIASHLLENARWGDAAKSDLVGTYQSIRSGHGYCSDFTTVFIAIARVGGMFAREWAFSFDGFGGHGHALVELWDRQNQRWMMLDVFNNWLPVDPASGQPLSVAEFRRRLVEQKPNVGVQRLGPGRFGFRDEADLWDYYRPGADQWYLWWGNAVHLYDASLPVRWLGPASRSLEQLGAVATGVHPQVRAVATPTNVDMRDRMQRLRSELMLRGFALIGLLLLVLWQVGSRLRVAARARH